MENVIKAYGNEDENMFGRILIMKTLEGNKRYPGITGYLLWYDLSEAFKFQFEYVMSASWHRAIGNEQFLRGCIQKE
ncbi:MAG: hypothetical protein K2O91_09740 [Lachnospiraceae bacterium]|nr:hypothetical protein [Lachnospiraceae bacterium]